MRQFGSVDIPQEAFIEVLKINKNQWFIDQLLKMINDLIFFIKNKTKTKVIILFLFNKIIRFFLKTKIKKFKRDHKIYLLKKRISNDYF
jgi:hypothetical protein